MKSLSSLGLGKIGVVQGVSSENAPLQQRLLAMGFVAGTKAQITGHAPYGNPIRVSALGYSLALRISEASAVLVVPCQP